MPVRVTAIFEPENDGIYYFGFHGISDPYEFYLIVDDIAVIESDGKAPGLSTELTATAGAEGASSAEISFVTPTLTENGSELTELSLVELRRDGQLIKSWENPGTGVRLSHNDEDASLAGASHSYSVICSNASGESAPASVKVYIGEDYPDRVVNLKAMENEDGTVTITWECPERGENGGYVNPANVTYMISRHFADDGRINTLASTSETSYTDNFESEKQTVLNYMVRPQNGVGMGRWSDSETLVLGGTPIEYPFEESAAGGYAEYPLWGSENQGTKGAWYIAERGVAPVCSPQDNDGGMFEFVPEAVGDKSRLASGSIDARTSEDPVLTFWYYAAGSNRLSVQVNPDNSGWQTLRSIDLGESEKEGWTKVRVNLSDLGAKRTFRLGFLGEAVEVPTGIYIDNIRLYDTYPVNLGITSAEFPESVASGKEMKAVVTVENNGAQSVSTGKLELTRNGENVGTFEIPALASGESAEVEVSEQTDATTPARVIYNVAVKLDKDADESDNYAAATVEIRYGYDLPVPTGLQGDVKDDEVTLSWNAPAAYTGTKEDFESYEPFGFLSNIGPWHSIDGNGTGKITPVDGDNAVDFPTAGMALGFQVFDARAAKMTSHDLDGRSGSKVVAAFADKQGANNDWLISPEIKGGSEVVFYAKGGSRYFEESLEVMYSSSDQHRESFQTIGGVRKVGSDWTEIRFTLPEDAKYFAIRYCSFDCYALLIDDINYVTKAGEATLSGYNIYRDGKLFASTDADVTSHTDIVGTGHTYAVTALYDCGESLMSEPINVIPSGVENIEPNSRISIYVESGIVCVKGAERHEMRVWSTDGTLKDSRICEPVERLRLDSGVYIIVIDNHSWKVRV